MWNCCGTSADGWRPDLRRWAPAAGGVRVGVDGAAVVGRGGAGTAGGTAVHREAYQLAGEIHVDRAAYTEAMQCYALACTAAREAGSSDLWATALTQQAYIALYDGRPDQAVATLDGADRLAKSGDSELVTRHWIAAVRAEANAAAGDEYACLRDLDTADSVVSRSESGQAQQGWLRFDGSRLLELRGSCLVALGRHDAAEAPLLDALRGVVTTRRRAAVLCDLALVGVRLRDIGRVVGRLDEVLVSALSTGSGVIAGRLNSIRRELEPLMEDRTVREIDGRIRRLRLSGPARTKDGRVDHG